MNILVVEDESRVADFLLRGLKAEGWLVEHADSGETALDYMKQRDFDLIVLDLMLPGIGGLDVCQKMRARGNLTPVLILSALDSTEERVAGLRMGADDYLTKPFEFDELIARIEALVRRHHSFSDEHTDSIKRYRQLVVNTRSMTVTIDSEEIEMTAREREMLLLFMSNQGTVIARERILNTLWGAQADPMTNVIDVYIGRLRRKLGDYGKEIRTVRGHGYRFGS